MKEHAMPTDELNNTLPTAKRVYVEAAKLFRERGYTGATTRELSERLNVNKASLYYHVSKKEDLLYRICVDSLTQVHKEVSEAVKAASDADSALSALVAAHLHAMLSEIDMHATMMLERRHLTGERYEEVHGMQRTYHNFVVGVIERAQAEGSVRRSIPAPDLTLALLNTINWTIAWYRPESHWDDESLSGLLFEVFFHGVSER